MWERGEEDAILVGLDLDFYWSNKMTPNLYLKYVGAYQRKRHDELVLLDTSNHLLGQYIRTAIYDNLAGKKSYPKEPYLKQSEKRTYTREETLEYLKGLEDDGTK